MQFSKVGFGSLVIGLVILLAVWWFNFQSYDLVQTALWMGAYAIVGGLIWVGILLAVLGILMLVV
jgi:hypothetical protein